MVLPTRGLTRRRKGRFQGEIPLLGKERIRPTPFHALFERGQHALCPHRGFRPAPAGPGVSVLCSRCRHCRRSRFPCCGHHTSIFLRPFAPPALPGFHATTDALTPAWRLFVPDQRAMNTALSTQVSLCQVQYLPTLPSPNTPRRPACLVWFHHAGLPEVTPQRGASSPPRDRCVIWVSPFASRLTTTTGRIAFVILRTSRSPPVALHLASQRRSYVRLRDSDQTSTRTYTSLLQDIYKRTSGGSRNRARRRTPRGSANRRN